MTSARPFWRGVIACAPIAASVIPFAVIVAVSAGEAGMGELETIGLSLIVFAGAAQLTALELAKSGAPAVLLIGAAIVVNLRFVMYSAALSPSVQNLPRRTRGLMAYLLTDQAFALALPNFDRREPKTGAWFFFGAGLTLWSCWQLGTVAGVALGAGVPAELSLDFCVALAFVALVVPHLASRPSLAAATTSVLVYVLCSGLPFGLALLPATVSGVAAGVLAEKACG